MRCQLLGGMIAGQSYGTIPVLIDETWQSSPRRRLNRHGNCHRGISNADYLSECDTRRYHKKLRNPMVIQRG